MESALVSPAKAIFWGLPAKGIFIIIPLVGIGIFTYIMILRFLPVRNAAPDPRFNRVSERISGVFKYWLGQFRHPRYLFPGIMHILLFSGFLIFIKNVKYLMLNWYYSYINVLVDNMQLKNVIAPFSSTK